MSPGMGSENRVETERKTDWHEAIPKRLHARLCRPVPGSDADEWEVKVGPDEYVIVPGPLLVALFNVHRL